MTGIAKLRVALALALAVLSVAAMWSFGAIAVAGFILTPLPSNDEAPSEPIWSAEGLAWLSIAFALAAGSGPIADAIGGRRWLLVGPLVGTAASAVGAAVAVAA